MFTEVLPQDAGKTLAILGQGGLLKDTYLAGGTALALRIGHRISVDLDFFTQKKFDQKIMIERLSELPVHFQLERTDWQTILGFLGKTRFTFFYYKYPLLEKPMIFSGIAVAGMRDLASMKLAAISDRGTKRDFIDLYFIIAVEKFFTLRKVFDLYDDKFKTLHTNKMHLIKSLTYFEDAEGMEMPRMLRSVSWKEVKKFFEEQAKELAYQLLT